SWDSGDERLDGGSLLPRSRVGTRAELGLLHAAPAGVEAAPAQRQAAAPLAAAALLGPALACGLHDRDRRLGPLRGRTFARDALARAGRVGRWDRDPRLAR